MSHLEMSVLFAAEAQSPESFRERLFPEHKLHLILWRRVSNASPGCISEMHHRVQKPPTNDKALIIERFAISRSP